MRVLLVWPNRAGFGFKSMGLSLLSAILKSHGHEVQLFDTTYIELGSGELPTARSRIKIFKPVDTSAMGYDLSVAEGLFDPSVAQGYDDVNPSLHLPDISRDELVALRERFVLYVKFLPEYLPYVTRSEAEDEAGRNLTDALLQIYDAAVLMNDGRWDLSRPVDDDLRMLASIAA